MADLMDSLYFEEGFSIRVNSDSDPLFFLIDYGMRTYPMNMANQHYHDFYEIFIPLEDDAAHLINGRYVQLHKGDILFLRPHVLHMSIYPKRTTGQKRIIINFSASYQIPGMEYQRGKVLSLFDSDEPVLRLPPEYLNKVVRKLNDIFTAGKVKSSGWQLELYSLFILFMLEIARNSRHNIYKAESHPGLPDLKMYAITEYIETHYMEPLSLNDIAEHFAISPFYLSHQFTKVMGMSFVTYIQRVRIRYALQMLSYTDARIHDIIADCGFSSSSQFNRTFTAFCSMSPSAFRKLSSQNKEIVISSLDPERSEVAPSAFPPRFKTLPRKRRGCDGTKIGVSTIALSPTDLQTLKEKIALVGAETVLLDIPGSFHSVESYISLGHKRILEIAGLGIDISVLGVSGLHLASADEAERRQNIDECVAAIGVASLLSVPYLAIKPGRGENGIFLSSLHQIMEKAAGTGVSIAVTPLAGTAVDGFDGAAEMIEAEPGVQIVLDPLGLVAADGRNNTFSFFEEVFSVMATRIVALLLRDSLDGHIVNIGKGIMAKTYPRIASLVDSRVPLIRAGAEAAAIPDDMLYIRRVFL